jgi:hypothetical protein
MVRCPAHKGNCVVISCQLYYLAGELCWLQVLHGQDTGHVHQAAAVVLKEPPVDAAVREAAIISVEVQMANSQGALLGVLLHAVTGCDREAAGHV